MMFKAQLRCMDAPSYKTAFIEFPAAEYKLQKQLDEIGVGIITAKNCFVSEIKGDSGGLQSLVGQCVNADEVQYLAKRMDSFDKNELQSFYAAAYADKVTSVKDLINLTFNLHCYTAVADFSDIATVGRSYELNRLGGMSMAKMEQLDGAAIGRRLIDSGSGVVTPYGVLYHNGNVPELVYNGEQFPAYHYRSDDVATVTLEVGDYGTGIKYEYLYLPCFDVEIEKALNRLGVADATPCTTHLDSDYFSEEIQAILTEKYPLSEHLNTLNELTRCYMGFNDSDVEAFHAVVELAEPNSPEDILVLGKNFYEFSAIPNIHSAEEYGRYQVRQSCEMRMNLDKYIDFKSFGEDMIAAENGNFTDWGYIAYRGNTPAVLEILGENQQEQGMSMEMQ